MNGEPRNSASVSGIVSDTGAVSGSVTAQTIAGEIRNTASVSGSAIASGQVTGSMSTGTVVGDVGVGIITVENKTMKVHSGTTDYWNGLLEYVPGPDDIIVYTDASVIVEDGREKNVPGIKMGDGNAYCVDLPFISDAVSKRLLEHIGNNDIHITPSERAFWNNKLNFFINGEELQFTRN